jgi:hypothetical protein
VRTRSGTAVRLAARTLLGGLLAAVLVPRPGSAQDWLQLSTARQADGLKAVTMRVEYGAGILTVRPARAGDLYDAHMRYDASRFSPVRTFERSEGTATVHLGLRSLGDKSGVHIDWKDLGDENGGPGSKQAGSLEIGVSRDVPTDLRVAVGAAKSRLDLGGLPLTNFTLETGASDTRISFDAPNPGRMQELRIKAGAASLKADDLGNAHFDRLRVEGGVGDVTLNFDGDWTQDATAAIHMGLGSLSLRFPSDLGVRIDKSTVLASFNAAGFVKTDSGYETRNWASAAHHLELEINAAFGSIDAEIEP